MLLSLSLKYMEIYVKRTNFCVFYFSRILQISWIIHNHQSTKISRPEKNKMFKYKNRVIIFKFSWIVKCVNSGWKRGAHLISQFHESNYVAISQRLKKNGCFLFTPLISFFFFFFWCFSRKNWFKQYLVFLCVWLIFSIKSTAKLTFFSVLCQKHDLSLTLSKIETVLPEV